MVSYKELGNENVITSGIVSPLSRDMTEGRNLENFNSAPAVSMGNMRVCPVEDRLIKLLARDIAFLCLRKADQSSYLGKYFYLGAGASKQPHSSSFIV